MNKHAVFILNGLIIEMTLLSNNPTLFILGVVVAFYFMAFSIKFPIVAAAAYPFTFLFFTQTLFAVGGISPSKYLGVVLIFAGVVALLKDAFARVKRNYSLLGFFFLMMLFPVWILIRFVVEGSDINLALTFLLNALTTYSIVVIVNTRRRKEIMEVSLGAMFFLLCIGMIAAYYFPSLAFLGSLQQGEVSRTIGLVNDPNYGGAFIAIGFAYFLSKAVFFYETGKIRLFLLCLVGIAVSILGLFLTVSRAAILSVVVCLLITVLYGRIKLKHLSWLLPSGIAALFVIYRYFPDIIGAVIYRLSITTFDRSNVMRLEFFRAGLRVIRDNPLWGIGDFIGYHNAFIDVSVFSGLIGLGFFLLLIVVVFRMNARILSVSNGDFRDMARFVVLGLIVFLVNGMFIGMETERIVWYLFGWGMISFILFRKAYQDEDVTMSNRIAPPARLHDERVAL